MSEISASPVAPSRSSAILLPTLAAIASILCLPILVKHIQSRNLALSMLVFWIILENLFNLINPLLWPTNDFNSWWNGIGLCDIESKLRLAAYMGYIGALLCIYRQLAIILNIEQITIVPSTSQRRCRAVIEMAICFGCPVYIVIAHYVVQSGRYYIFAITGCVPILDSSWPSIVMVLIWPSIMWIVAATYCSVIIYRLVRYRRQVSSILSRPQGGYDQSHFVRIFAMATTLILIFLPVDLYLLVLNLSYRYASQSYSWSRIHSWEDTIFFMPSTDNENLGRWIEIVTGCVVFISFGLGRDGLLVYRRILLKMGFGRVFPGPRLPHNERANTALISTGRMPLVNRFGSIGSRARSVFRRNSSNDPLSVPDTSTSMPDSFPSPTTDVEKVLRRQSIPPRPARCTKSAPTPVLSTDALQEGLCFQHAMTQGLVPECSEEQICVSSLLQDPPPAKIGSARGQSAQRDSHSIVPVIRARGYGDTIRVV